MENVSSYRVLNSIVVRQEIEKSKMTINYDDRYFKSVSNSETGEVDQNTIFHYRQVDDAIWATYKGGQIKIGTLVAQIKPCGSLEMRYNHINSKNEIMTGKCKSKPEILPDGRLRLHETWEWTSGDFSTGNSIIEEFIPWFSTLLKRPYNNAIKRMENSWVLPEKQNLKFW